MRNLGNAGGTRMSRALAAVRAEVQAMPGAIAWTYFLTDGANQGEQPEALAREIEACKGLFQCDCRGIGVDWEPDELRHISNALLGAADAVPDPAKLDADFNASLQAALSKGVSGVTLDLWQPATSKLISLRQMQPDNVDITALGQAKSARVISFNIGSWGKETRDYHAVFEVQAGEIGDEMLVCRPSVVVERRRRRTEVAALPADRRDLERGRGADDAHQPGSRPLHRAGRNRRARSAKASRRATAAMSRRRRGCSDAPRSSRISRATRK